jgi:hypothetical protein
VKEKKYYNDFFEFWEGMYPNESEHTKEVALEAWDAAVNGFTIDDCSDIEICSEARSRGYEVARKE